MGSPATQDQAFWLAAPGQPEIRPEQVSDPAAGDVTVRTVYSGISRGTEAVVFRGRVPASQYQAMRCPFQAGDFPAPVKYGYAWVGRVEAIGDGVVADMLDRRVFCLFPHQTRYTVPAEAVVEIPTALPSRRAVLAANMETAVNALWDAAPRVGDRCVVVGAGTIGCLVAALLARIPGAAVQLVDIDPDKAAIAASLGVAFTTPAAAGGDADLVVHASGTGEGLDCALTVAGFEAVVLELSWFGDQAVRLPLGESFHHKRLTLLSSQVAHVAAARRARRSHRSRLGLALRLLTDDRFDCLLAADCRFVELPAVMRRLSERPAGVLCQVVVYD